MTKKIAFTKELVLSLLLEGMDFLTKAGERWEQLHNLLLEKAEGNSKLVLSTLTAQIPDWPQKDGKDIGLSTFQKLFKEAQDANTLPVDIGGILYNEVPACVKAVNAFNVWRSKQREIETGLKQVNKYILAALKLVEEMKASQDEKGIIHVSAKLVEDITSNLKAAGKIDEIAEHNKEVEAAKAAELKKAA